MTKDEFVERALAKSRELGEGHDGYWQTIAEIVSTKTGISVMYRGEYTQKQWNWLNQAKEQVRPLWDLL